VRGGALIAEAAAGASHLLWFVSATRGYVKGCVRCAIAESLHGIGPMRCSCLLRVPRGRWLDVPGSSQEMAGTRDLVPRARTCTAECGANPGIRLASSW
jgi:hypothetical protein